MDDWILSSSKDTILKVLISPQSRKNEIIGIYQNQLKIKIIAPPVDGKANECLLEYLSQILSIRISALEIIKGQTSKSKQIKIAGMTPEALRDLLQKYLEK